DSDFDAMEYDCEAVITNEEINKAVLMQNLTGLMPNVPPELREGVLKEIFDLVGLDANQLKSGTPTLAGQQPQQPGQPQQQPQPTAFPAQFQRAVTQPTINA